MTWPVTVRFHIYEKPKIILIVFNPQNPVNTLRNLTNMESKELIGAMIDKVNMVVDGG